MTELLCNYCNHSFKNKSNLDKHQKTTKYCIELQKIQESLINNSKENKQEELTNIKGQYLFKDDKLVNNLNISINKCNYCNKEFLRKDSLIRHKNKCKHKNITDNNNNKSEDKDKIISELKIEIENKDKIISELKIEIENKNKLFQSLENITIKAIENSGHKTNIINNKNNLSIFNNLTPLTDSFIKDQASLLKTKDIVNGAKSLALFARDHSFKDRVICTDVSRRNFIFKDENNNIIKDPKGVKITKKFIENNKPELINLLTQYSLTFYNENNFMDIKHKLEIDHCLDAIKSGDISYNADKYNNFEKIFTTCFGKFVFNKEYTVSIQLDPLENQNLQLESKQDI